MSGLVRSSDALGRRRAPTAVVSWAMVSGPWPRGWRMTGVVGLAILGACAVGEFEEPTSFGPGVNASNATTEGSGDGGSGSAGGPDDSGSGGMADDSGGSDTVGPPCGDTTCDANASCEAGSCVCEPGYEGDGITCSDIDGCAAMPCFVGVECVDEPGEGYTCGSCPAGYEGDGITCADMDGCAGSPCF